MLVRTGTKTKAKKKVTFIIALVFLIILAIHLTVRVETIKLGYIKTKTLLSLRRLEERNRELKKNISQLKSPDRLRKKGKEMGLCPPKPNQIVFIGE